jgi:anti-sigma factor RsiW
MDPEEAAGCALPPALTEEEISAAADGTPSRRVRAHLRQCAFCAARVAEARALEASLAHALHRFDCPPAQRLGEYALGLLSRADEQSIERHLSQCARCTAEVADVRQAIGTDSAEEAEAQPQASAPRRSWVPRVRLDEIFAVLLPRAPALALRGASSEREPIIAEAGDAVITLDVHPAGGDNVTVAGLVAALEIEPWIGALALLWQGGEVRAVAKLDENGGFACGPLPAGITTLRITPEHGPTFVVRDIALA